MKEHAKLGADILSSINFPYTVVPIVRHHHENWDGNGYPDRIKGTEIPIGARILAVVDCFDALTSDRPYRPRMSDGDAMAILLQRRGTMYESPCRRYFCGKLEQALSGFERGAATGEGPANPTQSARAEPSFQAVSPASGSDPSSGPACCNSGATDRRRSCGNFCNRSRVRSAGANCRPHADWHECRGPIDSPWIWCVRLGRRELDTPHKRRSESRLPSERTVSWSSSQYLRTRSHTWRNCWSLFCVQQRPAGIQRGRPSVGPAAGCQLRRR